MKITNNHFSPSNHSHPLPASDKISSVDDQVFTKVGRHTQIDRFIDGIKSFFGDDKAFLRTKLYDLLHAKTEEEKAKTFIELETLCRNDSTLTFHAEQKASGTVELTITNTENSEITTGIDEEFWKGFKDHLNHKPFKGILMPGEADMPADKRLLHMLESYKGSTLPLRHVGAAQLATFLNDLVSDIRKHPNEKVFSACAGPYQISLSAKEIKETLLFEVAASPYRNVAFHKNLNESGAHKTYNTALNELASLIDDQAFTAVLKEMQNEPKLLEFKIFQQTNKFGAIFAAETSKQIMKI